MLVERVFTFSLLFDNCSVTNIFLMRRSLFSYTQKAQQKVIWGMAQPFTNEGNNNIEKNAVHTHDTSTWLSLSWMNVICNTIIIHFNIWYHKSWFSFTRHSTVDTDREKQNGLKWKTLLLYNLWFSNICKRSSSIEE